MKTYFLLHSIVFCCCLLQAQTTILVNPSMDASIGFHDGYDSDDTNYGDVDQAGTFSQPSASGTGENTGWGIIQFDITEIPAGMSIDSAILSLKSHDQPHDGENQSWLSLITESWVEDEVTWNTKPAITEEGQINVPASTESYEDYDIDITAFVQYWVDNPDENFGIALRLQEETPTRLLLFHSTDATEESDWPLLSITYSQPSPVETETASEQFLISPDPADNFISVLVDYGLDFHGVIEIYDICGQLVITDSFKSKYQQIDIKHIPSGLYTLIIKSDSANVYRSSTFIKD